LFPLQMFVVSAFSIKNVCTVCFLRLQKCIFSLQLFVLSAFFNYKVHSLCFCSLLF
ncbi:hypothetical protein K443DRAFT_117093, partial [Laccaria amethystina LaAM-08-1]